MKQNQIFCLFTLYVNISGTFTVAFPISVFLPIIQFTHSLISLTFFVLYDNEVNVNNVQSISTNNSSSSSSVDFIYNTNRTPNVCRCVSSVEGLE